MKTEMKFKQLVGQAKKIPFLREEEKKLIHSNIVAFMTQNPLKEGQLTKLETVRGSFVSLFQVRKLTLKYASIVSVVAILLGSVGVSFAAQGSLPGDSLYP